MADESKTTGAEVYAEAPRDLVDQTVPDPEDSLGGRTGKGEPPHGGLLRHILSSLRPGQDLTRVTIPSFFLEDRSLLEKLTDTLMHPEILLAVPTLEDPAQRMLHMVKWYLSGWHYKTIGVKKPYNPIIGETFACAWKHGDGTVGQYIAEQVTHRPPVSAMYYENRKANVVINAQVWTKSKFKAPQTAVSILEGGADVHILNHKEMYRVTMPSYFAHGLLFGTLRTEVGGSTVIVCEKSGLKTDVTFHQKPMFGGEYHRVSGSIIDIASGKKLFSFKGKWCEDFQLTDHRTKRETAWFDVRTMKVAPKYVLPINKQGPWESRRLWAKVTTAIQRRPTVDWAEVDREKSALEEAQRLLPCHKNKDNSLWKTKFFHEREAYDPVAKEAVQRYMFDYTNMNPHNDAEPPVNLLWLSQTCRDVRTPDDRTGEVKKPASTAAAGGGEDGGAGAGSGSGAGGAGAGGSGAGDDAAAASGGDATGSGGGDGNSGGDATAAATSGATQ